jgi:hypothetical protein
MKCESAWNKAGSFIQTLTMVDVATGWTECCLPLVTRDGSLNAGFGVLFQVAAVAIGPALLIEMYVPNAAQERFGGVARAGAKLQLPLGFLS